MEPRAASPGPHQASSGVMRPRVRLSVVGYAIVSITHGTRGATLL